MLLSHCIAYPVFPAYAVLLLANMSNSSVLCSIGGTAGCVAGAWLPLIPMSASWETISAPPVAWGGAGVLRSVPRSISVPIVAPPS